MDIVVVRGDVVSGGLVVNLLAGGDVLFARLASLSSLTSHTLTCSCIPLRSPHFRGHKYISRATRPST